MSKQCNEAFRARPPLDLRLARLKGGLVSDNRVVDAKLARISSFPLSRWFGDHPERLEQLRRTLPGITEDMTFGQAAALLWEGRKTERWRQWQQNMWLLLAPLLDIDQHMIKLNDGGAVYWGSR